MEVSERVNIDDPTAQYAAFLRLWDEGHGWSQWLTVNDEGKAMWR